MPNTHDLEVCMQRAARRLIAEGIQAPNDAILATLSKLEHKGDKAGIIRTLDRLEGLLSVDSIQFGWRLSHSKHVFYAEISRGPDDRIYDLDPSDEENIGSSTTMKVEINYRTSTVQVVPTGVDACGEREFHVAAVLLEEQGIPKGTVLEAIRRAAHIVCAKHDWIPDPDPTWKALPVTHGRNGFTADDATIERWLKFRLRVFAVIQNQRA